MATVAIVNNPACINFVDSSTGALVSSLSKYGLSVRKGKTGFISFLYAETESYSVQWETITGVPAPYNLSIEGVIGYLHTLQQAPDYLQLGGNGTDYINAASGAVTGKIYAAVVANEDTVFSALEDSAGQDILTYSGLGTNVLSKGMTFRARNGLNIAEVTITSGSVIGIINY